MGGLIQDIKLIGADLPKLEALREKGRNSFKNILPVVAKVNAPYPLMLMKYIFATASLKRIIFICPKAYKPCR